MTPVMKSLHRKNIVIFITVFFFFCGIYIIRNKNANVDTK